jgi:hypothetical protein
MVEARSIKVLAELKFPVMQANFSALVESELSADRLPGLVPGQQQLDFGLTTGTTSGAVTVCDLLEAGIKEARMSLAAHVLRSETNSSPILTWDSLQASHQSPLPIHSLENEAAQHVHVSLCVPVLWCQLASPPCGLPDPAAGGLDVLLLHDAIRVWQDPIVALKESILALLKTKTCRDQQVMLTLITNAVQNQPMVADKPYSPILAELSVHYRNTVLFSCLHLIWRALPLFSEVHVPPSSLCADEVEAKLNSHNQFVALLLALASHLHTTRALPALWSVMRPVSPAFGREADQCSTGYVSISPSPSEMAMPNRVYANRRYWEEEAAGMAVFSRADHNTLTVLREALIPLFASFGVPVEHQLQLPVLNTAQFLIDFSIELRDATLFILDHVSSPSIPPSLSTTPTLLVEQLLIQGCIKHNSEVTTSLPQAGPSLLLPTPGNAPANSTKAGLQSNCCASVEGVHAAITAPLLKLTKHVNVTGRLRRMAWKHAQLERVDAMETPRPPSSALPTVETDSGEATYVIRLASSLVEHLRTGHEAADIGNTEHEDARLISSSSIKVVDFEESPQPYKVVLTSASPVPMVTGAADTLKPPPVSTRKGLSGQSSAYSSSDIELSQSVPATEGTSPEDIVSTMDTCDDDTTGTDSQHLVSSDIDRLTSSRSSPRRLSIASLGSMLGGAPTSNECEGGGHAQLLLQGLSLSDSELQFSVFVLAKVNTVKVELQVETTRAILELTGISAAVDTRSALPNPAVVNNTLLPLLSDVLPTYLSVAATLTKTSVYASDKGLPESDLIKITLLPMYVSVAISNCPPVLPSYRCLLKLTQIQVDIKQSAVKIHKRFQELMPAFTRIYDDIFGDSTEGIPDSAFSVPSFTSDQQVPPRNSMENVIKLPMKLPQGFIHFSLDKAGVYVAPLPSLSVTYMVCN